MPRYRQQGGVDPIAQKTLDFALNWAQGRREARERQALAQQEAAVRQQERMQDNRLAVYDSLLGSNAPAEAAAQTPGITQQIMASPSEQWGGWMRDLSSMEVPDAFEEDRRALIAQGKRLEQQATKVPPEVQEQMMGRMMAAPKARRVMQAGRPKPGMKEQLDEARVVHPTGVTEWFEIRNGQKIPKQGAIEGSWAKVGADAVEWVDEQLAKPVKKDIGGGVGMETSQTLGEANPSLRWKMIADRHVATMFGASDEEIAEVRAWYEKRAAEVTRAVPLPQDHPAMQPQPGRRLGDNLAQPPVAEPVPSGDNVAQQPSPVEEVAAASALDAGLEPEQAEAYGQWESSRQSLEEIGESLREAESQVTSLEAQRPPRPSEMGAGVMKPAEVYEREAEWRAEKAAWDAKLAELQDQAKETTKAYELAKSQLPTGMQTKINEMEMVSQLYSAATDLPDGPEGDAMWAAAEEGDLFRGPDGKLYEK